MKRLVLLRHAKAAPQGEAEEDRARPLIEKGERAMRAIAAWVKKRRLGADLVLCSPAVRTRQTLALLLPSLSGAPQVEYEEGLYLAEPPTLLRRLRKLPETREIVLLVGHNPGIHELGVLLAGQGGGAPARHLRKGMPTGALAVFEIDGNWAGLDGGGARLVDFVAPKELGG